MKLTLFKHKVITKKKLADLTAGDWCWFVDTESYEHFQIVRIETSGTAKQLWFNDNGIGDYWWINSNDVEIKEDYYQEKPGHWVITSDDKIAAQMAAQYKVTNYLKEFPAK